MTVSIIETVVNPVTTTGSDTVAIATTLTANDRVVIIAIKNATAGTPSASGLSGTWTANVTVTATADLYVLSAGGMTGSGNVTVANLGTQAWCTGFVLRSSVSNAVRFLDGNGNNNASLGAGVTLATTAATDLAGSMVFGAAYLSTAGTGVFPHSSSTPSSGWTNDRAVNPAYVIHQGLTSDTSVSVAMTATGAGFGGSIVRAAYYDDSVPSGSGPLTSTFVGWGNPIF